MTERRRKIHETVDELDQHLEAAEPIDPELHEPLRTAIDGVKDALDPETSSELDGFAEGFSDLALRFEVAHPLITSYLNRISNALSAAGF